MKTKYCPLILLVINCLIILCTTYFPFQDLPQHLTYTKIFADYGVNKLFTDSYSLPQHFDPYFTLYYIMLPITKVFGSSIWAFKVVMLLYVIALYFAAQKMMNAFSIERTWYKDLLFSALIFNGTLYMGFISFAIMMPGFMYAISYFIQILNGQTYKWKKLAITLTVMTLFHIFSSFGFLIFITIYTIYHYSRKNISYLGLTWLLYMVFVFLLYYVGGTNAGGFNSSIINSAMDNSFGLEWIGSIFKTTWSDRLTTLNYVLWHLIGPYNNFVLLICSPFLIASIYILIKNKQKMNHRLWLVCFTYLIFCMLLPWGIEIPSEITYINYRYFTFGMPVLLLVIIGGMNLPKSFYLCIVAFFFVTNTSNLMAFHNEATKAMSIIDQVPHNKVLGSLVFRNQSIYFSKMHRADHFYPMYYSAKGRGINSQFWANYTQHLPIAYTYGHRVNFAADWIPTDFRPEQINNIDYLYVEYGQPQDPENLQQLSRNTRNALLKIMHEVSCVDQFCLYEKK